MGVGDWDWDEGRDPPVDWMDDGGQGYMSDLMKWRTWSYCRHTTGWGKGRAKEAGPCHLIQHRQVHLQSASQMQWAGWLACWRGKGIPDVDVEILSCPGVWNQSITWGGWYEVTLERVWFAAADHPLCLPASTQTPSKVGPACTMTTSKGLRDCP